MMPKGLCNALATCQLLMKRIFHACIDDFVVVDIGDLLIFSKNEEEHLQHVETVSSRLKEHQLYVSPRKCEFLRSEIQFLGLIVGKEGVRVNPEKAEVLRTRRKPETLTELRSFLGLLPKRAGNPQMGCKVRQSL